MSKLIVVDDGERTILDAYIAIAGIGGGFSLRLFTNDVTAGLTNAQIDALTAGAFTQATFPGYAAITVSSGWTTTEGNPTETVNTVRTFTRSSTGTAQLIRGYCVVDVGASGLQWFEQFDAPLSVEFLNDKVEVTPRLTLDDVGGNAMPTGTIVGWPVDAASAVPVGWKLCNGAAVSRSTFAALFAQIGTAYGVGDGSTTFNLPDFRQRMGLGQAASGTGVNVGDTGGSIDHVHALDVPNAGARIRFVTGDVGIRADEKSLASWTSDHDASAGLTAGSPASGLTSGAGLSGDTGTKNPPFVTLNYIIKT